MILDDWRLKMYEIAKAIYISEEKVRTWSMSSSFHTWNKTAVQAPKKVSITFAGKALIFFWNANGIFLLDNIEEGKTVTRWTIEVIVVRDGDF